MFSNLWQTTVQFPFAVNLIVYIALVVLALGGLYFIWQRGRALEAGITAALAIYVARSVSRTSTHEVLAPEAETQQGGKA